MRAIGWLLSLGGTLAMTAGTASAEPRPSSVALGVAASVEETPFGDRLIGAGEMVGMPVSIDAGTIVTGEVWWHISAHFGASTIERSSVEGHTFELQTGPRVRHCLSDRTCIGASLEAGWGRSRWSGSNLSAISYDDIHLEARLRASIALTPSGRVSLEGSVGPRARHYARSVTGEDSVAAPGVSTRGLVLGLALVVRN